MAEMDKVNKFVATVINMTADNELTVPETVFALEFIKQNMINFAKLNKDDINNN